MDTVVVVYDHNGDKVVEVSMSSIMLTLIKLALAITAISTLAGAAGMRLIMMAS